MMMHSAVGRRPPAEAKKGKHYPSYTSYNVHKNDAYEEIIFVKNTKFNLKKSAPCLKFRNFSLNILTICPFLSYI